MPRLQYTVATASSEHPAHPASELNHQTERTIGWHSGHQCRYPQDVVLRFEHAVQISRLQLLSHESKIATRIELALIDKRTGIHHWARIGGVALSSNDATNHRARELKSVQLSGECTHLRLRAVGSHPSPLNPGGQVAIIAVSVFGRRVEGAMVSSEALDLLARDLGVDRKMAWRIRHLVAAKEAAVVREDYDAAKRHKHTMAALLDLDRREKEAVAVEDYDSAKRCAMRKCRLLEGRRETVPALRLPDIHNSPPSGRRHRSAKRRGVWI